MGFDPCGAGGRRRASRPMLPMPNGLARGVRAASDFLMALQLTGAAKKDSSIANLQLRLPVVVIGGGLTAIDTATEALGLLPGPGGEVPGATRRLHEPRMARTAVRDAWTDEEETEIADEFLSPCPLPSGRTGAAKAAEGRAPRIASCWTAWGGVTMVYRRLIDAPVLHAQPRRGGQGLEEGIRFRRVPVAARTSMSTNYGHAKAMRLEPAWSLDVREVQRASDHGGGRSTSACARTVLVAAGTQPNTVLAREHPENASPSTASISRPSTSDGKRWSPERTAKPARPCGGAACGRKTAAAISFWGDLHPVLRRQRGQGHGRRQAGLSAW